MTSFLAAQAGQEVAVAYTLSDMAADGIALLDHLGIESAHVVGASMGGMIAQTMAIEHPTRVRTLTSIMSMTGEPEYGAPTPEALAILRAAHADHPGGGDRQRGGVVEGDQQPGALRRGRWRSSARRRPTTGASIPSGVARQLLSILASGSRAEGLAALDVPTVVIHGDVDPLVTPSGGQRTAELVPGAELLMLEGMGHDLPLQLLPVVVDAITALAARIPRLNAERTQMSGPLEGLKIIEIAGIGPGPFCAMMLADMGADVVRVDRAQNVSGGDPASPPADVLNRGRRSIGVDLKHPDGVEAVLALLEQADGLLEGFRPGVMERLGLGPDAALARNPRLVYGRMTGWGQDGPYALAAGHDINYIALAGALDPIGRRGGPPVPPLNLVGDFGGGGMLLAFGMACGLVSAQRTGTGQVIDAAMVDGSAVLTTMFHAFRAMGIWQDERGTNMLDTGAHYYDVYETADGKYVSIGSIEPQFYKELLRLTDLEGEELP